MRAGFQAANHGLQVFGELGLLHYQVLPHLHDLRNLLDHDRALFHAGATGCARPQRLFLDHWPNQRRLAFDRRSGSIAICFAKRQGKFERIELVQVFAKIEDQLLRRERLFGQRGRTVYLAAATFGTGVEIEQILPGELLEFAHA